MVPLVGVQVGAVQKFSKTSQFSIIASKWGMGAFSAQLSYHGLASSHISSAIMSRIFGAASSPGASFFFNSLSKKSARVFELYNCSYVSIELIATDLYVSHFSAISDSNLLLALSIRNLESSISA
jgi:hypothetical protein